MDYSDDDDILDTESGDDNLYSEDAADNDPGFAEEDMDKDSTSQLSYVVLNEEDIRKHQRTDIEQVSTVLSISQAEAIALLLHYQWNASKVEDEWFTDEEKVRKSVGLLKEHVVVDLNDGLNIECGICFDSYLQKEIATVSCGHPYCKTCWTGYIASKINDGPGCLTFKCPDTSCSAVVAQDMINNLITKEEDKLKYYRYFLRSYIESSHKKIKWCPSPGCEYAVDFGGAESENYDVSCLCSYEFCWNCCEDAHRPVDCHTVAKWIVKNNNESENTTWILANTKPCPSCKRQIEKNQGCNHMRCSICKHSFCWACLGPQNNHVNCHNYNETEVKRERAEKAIDRYMHYYERWVSNQSSRLMAIADLKKLESVQLKKLCAKYGIPETQLQFTVEAWIQIIECRRVLKWTYAYGYYLPEKESTKKRFFEYLQGEAEVGLERLHHCAELEFKQLVKETEDLSNNLEDFRRKLIGLTKVTKTYFENLVKALENGLADVEHNECKSATKSKRQKLV